MSDFQIREGTTVRFNFFVEKGELNSDTKDGIFHRWADSYLFIEDERKSFTVAIVEVNGKIFQASPEGMIFIK